MSRSFLQCASLMLESCAPRAAFPFPPSQPQEDVWAGGKQGSPSVNVNGVCTSQGTRDRVLTSMSPFFSDVPDAPRLRKPLTPASPLTAQGLAEVALRVARTRLSQSTRAQRPELRSWRYGRGAALRSCTNDRLTQHSATCPCVRPPAVSCHCCPPPDFGPGGISRCRAI
jgi:hypothetical protein